MRTLIHSMAAIAALGLAACSQPAPAELGGNWTVNSADSHFSFVSVKAGTIAEAHSFSGLMGNVLSDGAAKIEIPLTSVETGIDLRNERMRDFLFQTDTFPTATVTTKLDPSLFRALGIGDSTTVPVAATLKLHGEESEIDTDLVVTRIAADKVLVETPKPIIVNADDFGLGGGVEKLRELANLPAITPAVPVSFSIAFTR